MANAISPTTMYVDSTGTLNEVKTRVFAVQVNASAANAILVLADATSDKTKLEFRVATSGDSKFIDFGEHAAVFEGGVKVATATNVTASIIYNVS